MNTIDPSSSSFFSQGHKTSDPGDVTQQRFRYQHAYGVMLLITACDENLYSAIWCEFYEDLLGERPDGRFDAYQVKTQLAEKGAWHMGKAPLRDSIKRFVKEDISFPERIREFFFVSNVGYENSIAADRMGRSPLQFIQAAKRAQSWDELLAPFDKTFETLRHYCACDASHLFAVLKRLNLVQGPDLSGYEAVIAHEHLPLLENCRLLPARALSAALKALIGEVYQASSLSSDDPHRHWYAVQDEKRQDPLLRAKRLATEDILHFLTVWRPYFLSFAQSHRSLRPELKNTMGMYLVVTSHMYHHYELLHQFTFDEKVSSLQDLFIDREVKALNQVPSPPLDLAEDENNERDISISHSPHIESISALQCILEEQALKIFLIGGPGQGKSTLGQFVAYVHLSLLLDRKDFFASLIPKTVRIPFILQMGDFARWQHEQPMEENIEAYIATLVKQTTSSRISSSHIQEVLKKSPSLIIFDELDDVMKNFSTPVLASINEFLRKSLQEERDIQVLITSRWHPASHIFNSRRFWYLELQSIPQKQIWHYAQKLISRLIASPIDQQRAVTTFAEILPNFYMRGVLTTPLQAQITLHLLIKGGFVPYQREAQFLDYWHLLFQREERKLASSFKMSRSLLFDLHAYLGFSLHFRSTVTGEAPQLSLQEFSELASQLLRERSSSNSDSTVYLQAKQLVKKARERLALVVEIAPGYIGFELRLFREFFAATYLVETSVNTQQRFQRLQNIACRPQWYNVALFYAGHIVRAYSGEAYLIEQSCRTIDQKSSMLILRPGARLALDMVAEGIFSSDHSLEYRMLQYAVETLAVGTDNDLWDYLTGMLQRLAQDIYHNMVSSLLQEKLDMLSLIKENDITSRIRGIRLLTLFGLPLAEERHRNTLLEAMQKAQEMDEIQAWCSFLTHVTPSHSPALNLQSLLADIIRYPRLYGDLLLHAATGRYMLLIDEEQDEYPNKVLLGLPTASFFDEY